MRHIGRVILSALIFLSGAIGCSTSPHTKVGSVYQPDLTREVSDAEVLFKTGYLELAQQKLKGVLQIQPDDAKARYYLDLAQREQAMVTQQRPRAYIQTIPQQPIY